MIQACNMSSENRAAHRIAARSCNVHEGVGLASSAEILGMHDKAGAGLI